MKKQDKQTGENRADFYRKNFLVIMLFPLLLFVFMLLSAVSPILGVALSWILIIAVLVFSYKRYRQAQQKFSGTNKTVIRNLLVVLSITAFTAVVLPLLGIDLGEIIAEWLFGR